jgi:hypothetical protein
MRLALQNITQKTSPKNIGVNATTDNRTDDDRQDHREGHWKSDSGG